MSNPHTPKAGSGLLALVNEAAELESRIVALAELNEGEVDAKLEGYLNEVKANVATKADHYKFVMDRLEMAGALLEQRADEFYRAAAAMELVRESMKARIKEAMLTMGTEELRGAQWRFKLSKTKGRLVLDENFKDKLPAEYLIVKTVYDCDKERVRAALEEGKEVPGAHIEPGHQLRTYVAKGDK